MGGVGQIMNFAEQQALQQKFHCLSNKQIQSIESQLSEKKYYEFMYHAYFNERFDQLDDFYNKWNPSNEWTYPVDDLVRFNKIIIENQKHIKGKSILDLGSHLGYLSLFCLNLGCLYVRGIEPRTVKNNIARFVCSKAGYENFSFDGASTHDDDFMGNNNVDTVIMSALIYHISDHDRVLEKISDSSASCLVIENREDMEIAFDSEPLLRPKLGQDNNGSWSRDGQHIAQCTPNQPWLNKKMFSLGWQLETNNYYRVLSHTSEKRLMSTSVYTR